MRLRPQLVFAHPVRYSRCRANARQSCVLSRLQQTAQKKEPAAASRPRYPGRRRIACLLYGGRLPPERFGRASFLGQTFFLSEIVAGTSHPFPYFSLFLLFLLPLFVFQVERVERGSKRMKTDAKKAKTDEQAGSVTYIGNQVRGRAGAHSAKSL